VIQIYNKKTVIHKQTRRQLSNYRSYYITDYYYYYYYYYYFRLLIC